MKTPSPGQPLLVDRLLPCLCAWLNSWRSCWCIIGPRAEGEVNEQTQNPSIAMSSTHTHAYIHAHAQTHARERNSIDALRCCAHHYVLSRRAFVLSDWLFPFLRCHVRDATHLLTTNTNARVCWGEREREREKGEREREGK